MKSGKEFVGKRGIHFDFKGLPPEPARLSDLLDLLSELGINCVLAEWEDMFPWKKYPSLRSGEAYREETVEHFIGKAEKLSIEVIPLVQCFGHMENVLAKTRFKRLREVDSNVSELCPCREESRELVLDLVEDVLRVHGRSTAHFHLGGDEAWTMGSCPLCREEARERGRASLYLRQVMPLLEYLGEKGIRPILWDDMMREWKAAELGKISGKADLMVWRYRPVIGEDITKAMKSFSRAGVTMWGASAFRGGDGAMADVPDIGRRRGNMLAWTDLHREFGLKGIMATGWGRYNTFAAPCESFETALDSLVISAWAMSRGSLENDCVEKAERFLHSGRMKKIAGARSSACREAGERVKQWRGKTADAMLSNWVRLPVVYGEKGRLNRWDVKRVASAVESAREEGVAALRQWKRAHEGLVGDAWLELYGKSRMEPFELYANALMKRISRYL